MSPFAIASRSSRARSSFANERSFKVSVKKQAFADPLRRAWVDAARACCNKILGDVAS